MGKAKKKKKKHEYVFIHGKRKRIKKPPMLEGTPYEEYIQKYADPIWLHQNEMHEILSERETSQQGKIGDEDDIPF